MMSRGTTLFARRLVAAGALVLLSWTPAARAAEPSLPRDPKSFSPATLALINRVTWGVDPADVAAVREMGLGRWLDRQLHPPPGDRLPPEVQAQIAAMPYDGAPVAQLVADAHAQQIAANTIVDPEMKAAARQVYNKALEDAVHQAAARSILRDLYSPDQLKEQMTWFWFNHFNVHMYKADLRLTVGDYEDKALRPHALGHFRDLLEATVRHPAMLRYLDNAENAAGHINENYAREIMELHTMGVGSGYTQKDVQELARILTGVGVDANPAAPHLPPQLQGQLIRQGLFEFNPARHDYGDKVFLGHVIKGRGFAEVEDALDILGREPATARHVSRELALYFVSDDPPAMLVQRMSDAFARTNGDIAEVLRTMFNSPEFTASLGSKFKDPMHYVISSVRLAYGDRPILNTTPILAWMNRMGEGLYNHETPDGFSMVAAAWNGPGQMGTRFEMARQLGASVGNLFKPDSASLTSGPAPGAPQTAPPGAPAYPILRTALEFDDLPHTLAPATQAVLTQANAPQDWNTLFLSSPEFMRR
jgi:uncharacterized protein (DUF1800 family)